MYETRPEQLRLLNQNQLPTGSVLLVYKPFTFYKLGASITCAGMRWILRSKRIDGSGGYHHAAVIFWIGGRPFVVEADFFQRSQPKRLDRWIQERAGYVVGVEIQEIPDEEIAEEIDKPYDLAAAFALLVDRISGGNWIGRTTDASGKKVFCWELVARVMNLEKAYKSGVIKFKEV